MNWYVVILMVVALTVYFMLDAAGMMGPSLYPAGW